MSTPSGATRDKVADRVGFGSGRTYARARTVWDAAQDGDVVAQDLVDQIDDGEESISRAATTLDKIDEFETNDTLVGLLDDLVTDGRLSGGDVRDLKAGDPPSVLGWLSAEQDILPLADGTLPSYTPGLESSLSDAHTIESAFVPVERIRSDLCLSAFGTTTSPVDDELLGLLAREYKEGFEGTPRFLVAPAENGTFHLIERTRYTAFKACELIGADDVCVGINAVDGTDTKATESYIRRAALADTQFSKPYMDDEFESAIEQFDNPAAEGRCRRIRRRKKEIHNEQWAVAARAQLKAGNGLNADPPHPELIDTDTPGEEAD